MDRIEQFLSEAPLDHGESRGRIDRVLIVPPLTARYEVHEDDRLVIVQGVIHHHRR